MSYLRLKNVVVRKLIMVMDCSVDIRRTLAQGWHRSLPNPPIREEGGDVAVPSGLCLITHLSAVVVSLCQ